GAGSGKAIAELISGHKPGDRSIFAVTGRSGPREVEVVWSASPTITVETFEKTGRKLTPDVRKRREDWLRSRSLAALPKFD
ncbi:MAG: hypothetical protein ABI824_13785, partial [Acidobacteriota bacterium]